MTSQTQALVGGTKRTCVCVRHVTAAECLAIRYNYTEFQRDEQAQMGELCECGCHYDYDND